MICKTLCLHYPVTSTYLPDGFSCSINEELPDCIRSHPKLLETYPFLDDLAEIENIVHRLRQHSPSLPANVDSWQIRPGVELLEVNWSGLPELLNGKEIAPVMESSYVLLIPGSGKEEVRIISPSNNDLLGLKLVVEKLDLRKTAEECSCSVIHIQNILALGARTGIFLQPDSKLIRPDNFFTNTRVQSKFLSADVFTLQWHITQSCDLHCRHCYDRSERNDVSLSQGKDILDQLYDFCILNNVTGQVSFSGGNPLLHPNFFDLYQEAVDRGFMVALLGNPTDRSVMEKVLAIHAPEFYQVSLEGLPAHNDHIRGSGHFNRTMQFLSLLKELDVYSMVMLTLTRANQEQVLPLAETLTGKADLFTFNRLAMVGEGAALDSVSPEDYEIFLKSYLDAATKNPLMRLKDNLFNILQLRNSGELCGGCTGYGCGAAFNFVSLLPDGQIHACRKFPSLIGNIYQDNLVNIYHSEGARQYRRGSIGCQGCEIRPVCGGCLAVTDGFGKNVLTEIDPYCFIER